MGKKKKVGGTPRKRSAPRTPKRRTKLAEVATPDIAELFTSLGVQSLSASARAAVAVRCAERALAELPDHPALRLDRSAVERSLELGRRHVTGELRTFDREAWNAFAAASNAAQRLRDVQGGVSSILQVCSDAISASLPANLASSTSMVPGRHVAELWLRLVIAPLQARSTAGRLVEAGVTALADDVAWLRTHAQTHVPRAFFDRPCWPAGEPAGLADAIASLRAELVDLNRQADPAKVFDAVGLDASCRSLLEALAPEELEQLVGFDASGERVRLPGLSFRILGPAGPSLLDRLASAASADDLTAALTARADPAAAVLPRLIQELGPRGLLVFVTDRHDRHARIAVLRSADRYDVLRAVGTSAPNFDLDTAELIARLQALEARLSFEIRGASSSWVELLVNQPPADPSAVATELRDLCPDVVDQGVGSMEALGRGLTTDALITLWWD